MPNRKDEVRAICARYPQAFGEPAKTLDARRRLLTPIVCRELNKLDDDNWFLLNRLDRNDDDPRPGRLSGDILVWKPTKEHVDIMGSSGGSWGEHPPITDKDWKIEHWSNWPSWDDVTPAPEPEPEPDKPPVPHTGSVDDKLDAMKDQLDAIHGRQDRALWPVPNDAEKS